MNDKFPQRRENETIDKINRLINISMPNNDTKLFLI